jgi:uncharacterized protein
MQERHGFAPLGPADGAVKSAILGLNAARMYGINLRAEAPAIGQDRFALARAATLHEPLRSNLAYGYVARRA